MSDLETRARERIDALREELDFLEGFLRNAARAKALLGDETEYSSAAPPPLNSVDAPVDARGEVTSDAPAKRKRVSDNPRPAILIPAAIEILRQHGKPMSRRELHEALSARGLVVRGSDPIKALGTILWRAGDDLVQLEGFGYWPKSDQYRLANYAGALFQDVSDGTTVRPPSV
jgi:hypothetical protein